MTKIKTCPCKPHTANPPAYAKMRAGERAGAFAYSASVKGAMIVLFRQPRKTETNSSNGASPAADEGASRALPGVRSASGLYADTENLQNHGQNLIRTLIRNWPPSAPPLALLTLYVRADNAELWRAWATGEFENLQVIVRGIQRFTTNTSKNSADVAIASNAMADWLLGRISHVAVISDDSDFISLYAAMRQELARAGDADGEVPFLWIVTDRKATVSDMARRFFPKDKLHVVSTDAPDDAFIPPPAAPMSAPAPAPAGEPESLPPPTGHAPTGHATDMARAIVASIPVGPFKSTDCAGIIQSGWPSHPLALANGPTFGTEFKNTIWPILRLWGVRIPNQNAKPLRYEMTADAKARANR